MDKALYNKAWKISKKYTTILMEHEDNNIHFEIAPNIYSQYLCELKLNKIQTKNKNYTQNWQTMINTLNNNPKESVCRASVKLLHQTSVQRSFVNN
jgi:hypothetical protein